MHLRGLIHPVILQTLNSDQCLKLFWMLKQPQVNLVMVKKKKDKICGFWFWINKRLFPSTEQLYAQLNPSLDIVRVPSLTKNWEIVQKLSIIETTEKNTVVVGSLPMLSTDHSLVFLQSWQLKHPNFPPVVLLTSLLLTRETPTSTKTWERTIMNKEKHDTHIETGSCEYKNGKYGLRRTTGLSNWRKYAVGFCKKLWE